MTFPQTLPASLSVFLEKHRYASILFLTALILQLFVFIAHVSILGNGPDTFTAYSAAGDSGEHLALAESLLHDGAFSQQMEGAPYATLETTRMPVYPALLAFSLALTGHNYALTMLIQLIPAAFAVVLLFLFLKEFLPDRIAFWGAFLAAFDAERLMNVTQFGSESYFFPFLFAGMLFAARLMKAPPSSAVRLAALSALFFGAATLTRYFAFFLAMGTLLFLLAIFTWRFLRRHEKPSVFLKPLAVFFVVFFLLLAPWSLRNFAHFGTFRLAATSQWSLYWRKVVRVYEYKLGLRGKSHASITNQLEADFFRDFNIPPERQYPIANFYLKDFAYREYFMKKGNAVIRENYPLYLKVMVWRFIPWSTDSSLSELAGYVDQYFVSLQPLFQKTGIQPFPHIFWAGRFFWIIAYLIVIVAFIAQYRHFLSARFLPLLYAGALAFITGLGAEWSFTTRHKIPFVLIFYGVFAYALFLLFMRKRRDTAGAEDAVSLQ